MDVIEDIVHLLTDEHGSPLVNFSEYHTLFFIILDQSIAPNELYLDSYDLDQRAYCIPYAQKVIFGQYTINETSYSAAIQLEIVAHEFCHILISKILDLNWFAYEDESGALEESFCDIFAVLISRLINRTWNFEIGQNMGGEPGIALRNLCDPKSSSPPQPSHYDYYDENQNAHINCGIHNKALCTIIDSGYFEVEFLIELLIRTISNITIADFSHSRKAMQECAENMLQRTRLGDADITIRVNAISKAFDEVGIELPT
jgi:bacillolysin/neutral peptidase B